MEFSRLLAEYDKREAKREQEADQDHDFPVASEYADQWMRLGKTSGVGATVNTTFAPGSYGHADRSQLYPSAKTVSSIDFSSAPTPGHSQLSTYQDFFPNLKALSQVRVESSDGPRRADVHLIDDHSMVLSFADGCKIDPSLNHSSAFLDTASGLKFTEAGSARSTRNLDRLGKNLPKTAALMVVDPCAVDHERYRNRSMIGEAGREWWRDHSSRNKNDQSPFSMRGPPDRYRLDTAKQLASSHLEKHGSAISNVGVMAPTGLYLSEYQSFIDSAAGIPGVQNLSIQTAGKPPPLSFVSDDYVDRALRHYPNVTLDATVSPSSLCASNEPGVSQNKHDKHYYDESFIGKDSFEGTPRRLTLRLSGNSDSAKGRNMGTAHNMFADSGQAASSKEAINTLVSMFAGQQDPYRDVVFEPRGAQPTWVSELCFDATKAIASELRFERKAYEQRRAEVFSVKEPPSTHYFDKATGQLVNL